MWAVASHQLTWSLYGFLKLARGTCDVCVVVSSFQNSLLSFFETGLGVFRGLLSASLSCTRKKEHLDFDKQSQMFALTRFLSPLFACLKVAVFNTNSAQKSGMALKPKTARICQPVPVFSLVLAIKIQAFYCYGPLRSLRFISLSLQAE